MNSNEVSTTLATSIASPTQVDDIKQWRRHVSYHSTLLYTHRSDVDVWSCGWRLNGLRWRIYTVGGGFGGELGGGASGIVAVVAFPDMTNLIKGLVGFWVPPHFTIHRFSISIIISRSLSISINQVRWSATDVCPAGQSQRSVKVCRYSSAYLNVVHLAFLHKSAIVTTVAHRHHLLLSQISFSNVAPSRAKAKSRGYMPTFSKSRTSYLEQKTRKINFGVQRSLGPGEAFSKGRRRLRFKANAKASYDQQVASSQ